MSDTKTQASVIVAALIAKVGASAMARRLGVTEGACRSHATGSAPRAGMRARYLELYDVPLIAWTTPAGTTLPPPRLPQDAPAPSRRTRKPSGANGSAGGSIAARGGASAGTVDARTEVVELLAVARDELEAAQADEAVPYRERAALITAATGLVRLLARLSGQLEVTESQIVRSAPWARAMGVVREVLARHPAAAAELNAALEAFAAEGGKTR